MGDFPIVFQVLVGVLALFFIYLTYMNVRTWRWVHVTFMFLVFAGALGFMFLAALTLKTRAAWVGLHHKTKTELATTEEQIEKLTQGTIADVERKEPSISSLREQLSGITLDRGRVWRGCMPTGATPEFVVTLATSPPPLPPLDPSAPPPVAPATKNNIQPKTILHAFSEAPLQPAAPPGPDAAPPEPGAPERPKVPVAYIGEFEVTAATDTTVTIRPTTLPLGQDQQAAGSVRGATWALYEVCPVDGHEWFTRLIEGKDERDARTILQQLMPAQKFGLPQEQYQRLIDSYFRDGKPANLDSDPPENIWVPVKFVQRYKMQVDGATVNSIDVEPFNAEGQAQLDRLRRAKPGEAPAAVEFGPEPPQIPTALLDKQTADDLIARGVCVADGTPIYRRKLTDYERKFHGISLRIAEIGTRMRELDLDNKALLASTAKAEAQSKLLDDLKVNLVDDLAKAQAEQQELKKYTDSLQARLTEVQSELSQLYRSNKALSRELAELNAELTDEIERRSRAATARVP